MLKQYDQVPKFTLPKVDGGTFSSEQLIGKKTLIYFMRGTW
ncbi:redoxin domain-containing protein [Lottiidibacillus patelloidae]|nr:redoxin domain-containing protein [Lottiidibacillus patelloidae]